MFAGSAVRTELILPSNVMANASSAGAVLIRWSKLLRAIPRNCLAGHCHAISTTFQKVCLPGRTP